MNTIVKKMSKTKQSGFIHFGEEMTLGEGLYER